MPRWPQRNPTPNTGSNAEAAKENQRRALDAETRIANLEYHNKRLKRIIDSQVDELLQLYRALVRGDAIDEESEDLQKTQIPIDTDEIMRGL